MAAAKAVCRRCPVRDRCLAEALERLPHGIAGGLTERERRRVRAARGLGTGRRPRWRVLLEAGSPPAEVARECGVSVRTVERWAAPTSPSQRDRQRRSWGWFPVSAIEISRREQAASSTREHVRRVAVTAYGAIEEREPIEGFHGLSRPVLDDPLAGVRAGRLVADVAAGALREWALRARGAGRSWDDVGAALELPAALDGVDAC